MPRFMQLMLDGKPVAVPEDQYHTLVLRAQAQARQSKPQQQRPEPVPQADDSEVELAAWRGE